MKNRMKLIFMLILALGLVVGCSNKDSNKENSEPETEAAPNEEENEELEEEENLAEEEEEEIEKEGPTFADEIRILNFTQLLLDAQEVDSVVDEGLIEHEQTLYIESELITEILDFEIRYDEEKEFVEVFHGKSDFTYTPLHEIDGGSVLLVGEIYNESDDEYVSPREEYVYDFIEYNNKMYIPERVLAEILEQPLNYHRKDGILEVGLRQDPTYIQDFDVQNLKGDAGVTEDSKYTTIKGEKYDSVVYVNKSMSFDSFHLVPKYEYSLFEGFIYNNSDVELKLTISENEAEEIHHVTVPPKETADFSVEIKGIEAMKMYVKNTTNKTTAYFDYSVYGEFK